MRTLTILLLTLTLASGLVIAQSQTAPLAAGSTLPTPALEDQHGEPGQFGEETRTLLFSAEKAVSGMVNEFLGQKGPDFMREHRVQFVADISAMPGMIARMFALPKLRKLNHKVLLSDDEHTLAFLPRQSGQVTVLQLAQGKVERISFLSSQAELENLFQNPN